MLISGVISVPLQTHEVVVEEGCFLLDVAVAHQLKLRHKLRSGHYLHFGKCKQLLLKVFERMSNVIDILIYNKKAIVSLGVCM